MTVGVGVIGTGMMGADHVRTLSHVAGARVTTVNDLDTDRARQAVERSGSVEQTARVLTDPLAVVHDPDTDAVIVASGNDSHEELVSACLGAGKPVLCEKPLAPEPEGALRIIELERSSGRRLVSVGFMRRYDPGYLSIARTIASRELGAPLLLHNIHRNAESRPNTPSSGLLHGSAVHEFDVVRWLCGEEIAEITVHRPRPSSLVVGDTQDPMLLVLRTASGVLATVEVFVNARYGYDVRCELVAEQGSVGLDLPAEATVRDQRRAAVGVAADWRDRFAEAYRRQSQDWIDGIRLGEQRGATAWDGYVATALAVSAIEALESGRTVSPEVPERPEFYYAM